MTASTSFQQSFSNRVQILYPWRCVVVNLFVRGSRRRPDYQVRANHRRGAVRVVYWRRRKAARRRLPPWQPMQLIGASDAVNV